jgi:hypothetical protein
MSAIGGDHFSAFSAPLDAFQTHQTRHSFVIADHSFSSKLSVHSWTAIGTAAFLVNAPNMLNQRSPRVILLLLLLPLSPGIIAAPRDSQHFALLPHWVVLPVIPNEPVLHFVSFE